MEIRVPDRYGSPASSFARTFKQEICSYVSQIWNAKYGMLTVWLILPFASVTHAADKTPAGETEKAPKLVVFGLDNMPVIYKESMIVVRNEDGAAAIVFEKPIAKGVTYRYRFLPKGQNKEQIGEGKVFHKTKEVWSFLIFQYRVDDGSKLYIEAGPISLRWAFRTNGSGWILYDSAQIRIQTADAKEFAKIDLKRFVK